MSEVPVSLESAESDVLATTGRVAERILERDEKYARVNRVDVARDDTGVCGYFELAKLEGGLDYCLLSTEEEDLLHAIVGGQDKDNQPDTTHGIYMGRNEHFLRDAEVDNGAKLTVGQALEKAGLRY